MLQALISKFRRLVSVSKTDRQKRFFSSRSGNVIVSASLITPVLLSVAGFGVDYAVLNSERSRLQEIADATALAAVQELSLSGANEGVIRSAGEAFADGLFVLDKRISNGTASVDVDITPSVKSKTVEAKLAYYWQPFLAHIFDQDMLPIRVSATATLAGEALTCIVGLMQPQSTAKASIHIDNNAAVRADDCVVYSNSVSRYGLRADSRASMTAGSICSAGGVLNMGIFGRASFSPKPITDCPKIEDPLRNRAAPSYSGCGENKLVVANDETLKAGVYCGGLTVTGNSKVTLEPGIYVIKDGPLSVKDSASLIARGVTFFLAGDDSLINFEKNTQIDLEAMEKGPTAGLLFFEDRNVDYSFDFNPFLMSHIPDNVRVHRISSNYARNLLGTIYLSRSILLVDAQAAVADVSAYTAIITGRLWLREGPTLFLNADLSKTKVPAPEGLIGTEPRLLK